MRRRTKVWADAAGENQSMSAEGRAGSPVPAAVAIGRSFVLPVTWPGGQRTARPTT